MRGIDEARVFYEAEGKELLHREFPEIENRIAVGLAGHGSECFGFDDELSRDHDFEKGLCLWIDDETDIKYGVALQRAYRRLTGADSVSHSSGAEKSRGVIRISDFFRRYTGTSGVPESWQDWMYLPSRALAESINGAVFRDDSGIFSGIRERIRNGMPEDVRKKKLAASTIMMAQSGQYNYSRCIRHGEDGAAMMAMSEFVTASCRTVYLLNRSYMPYYKWVFRGMDTLPILGDMKDALEFLLIGDNDDSGKSLKSQVVEDIAGKVISELQKQQLTCGKWDYLEPHALHIMEHIENPAIRALHVMDGY